MKMNKKGFTLIEMLVVIAIIAVLVSIIIPTVTSATDKAEAASIAANLRSVKAEIATEMLTANPTTSGTTTSTSGHWVFTFDDDDEIVDDGIAAASDYEVPFDDASDFAIDYVADTGALTVTYDGYDIADYAEKAETGSFPEES